MTNDKFEQTNVSNSKLGDSSLDDQQNVRITEQVNSNPPMQHSNRRQAGGPSVAYKNLSIGFLLSFIFGPLGMLYSTVSGAIIMFIVGIFCHGIGAIVTIFSLGFGIIFWLVLFLGLKIIHLFWTNSAINEHNNQIDRH